MKCNHLIYLCILFIQVMCTYMSAMDVDTPQNVTPLNNGLLTSINGIILYTGFARFSYTRQLTATKQKKDSLINLLFYEENLDRSQIPSPMALFFPLVFKVSDQNIEELGHFDKKKHREAKEAIRQNKAIYLAVGQGALIYAVDAQPNPEIALFLVERVEKKIDEHKKEIKLK